jgi:hypothetical protein
MLGELVQTTPGSGLATHQCAAPTGTPSGLVRCSSVIKPGSVMAAGTPPGPAAHATKPCTGRRWSYYRTISYAYRKHVEPKWASVPVNKVDSLDVKAWAASMTRNGSSAAVVNRAVGILAGVLDDAVEHRALAFNPARRFKRGEKPKKSPKRPCLSHRKRCVPAGRGVRPSRRPGADPRVHRVAVG